MHTPPALPRRFQGGGRVRTPGSHRQGKDNVAGTHLWRRSSSGPQWGPR
ncbi:IKZF4 isoform 6 [Pan troglodytes]|uniref:IKAROS family zinc finger 4 n=3 Tax=Hominidae TaxID=9604 RepID=F8VW19_HUMAN|nr:IKZF4 isoform 6 [Pan troglodytes]PNJ44856.1 IKZF4 isoform 4 [Pongo abelii]